MYKYSVGSSRWILSIFISPFSWASATFCEQQGYAPLGLQASAQGEDLFLLLDPSRGGASYCSATAALGGVLQRGAGQGEREHGACTSSFSPATPRGKRAGPRAWLLVANCRGYITVVEIAMRFVTPHFNLICCGVRLEKQLSSFSILPVLTAVVTKPTFHFRHILMMDCSGMKTSHPAKL